VGIIAHEEIQPAHGIDHSKHALESGIAGSPWGNDQYIAQEQVQGQLCPRLPVAVQRQEGQGAEHNGKRPEYTAREGSQSESAAGTPRRGGSLCP
jgi:hypothetical protein